MNHKKIIELICKENKGIDLFNYQVSLIGIPMLQMGLIKSDDDVIYDRYTIDHEHREITLYARLKIA